MNLRTKVALAIAAGIFGAANLNMARAQAPTDPQIVGIVVAANDIDIAYGKLALTKSHDKQMRDFAQQMVTDHSAVQKSVFDLGAKLHVTPADSDTSAALKKQAAETTEKLTAKKAGTFPYTCTLHPNMKATLTVK